MAQGEGEGNISRLCGPIREWRFRPANPLEPRDLSLGYPRGERRRALAAALPRPALSTAPAGRATPARTRTAVLFHRLGHRERRAWPLGMVWKPILPPAPRLGSATPTPPHCREHRVFGAACGGGGWAAYIQDVSSWGTTDGGGQRGGWTKARWGRDTAGPRGLRTRAALWDSEQWAGVRRAGGGSQGWGWGPAQPGLGTGRASGSLRLSLALAPPLRDAQFEGRGAWDSIQAPQWSFVCWPRRGGAAGSWPIVPHSLASLPAGQKLGSRGWGMAGSAWLGFPQEVVAGGLHF